MRQFLPAGAWERVGISRLCHARAQHVARQQQHCRAKKIALRLLRLTTRTSINKASVNRANYRYTFSKRIPPLGAITKPCTSEVIGIETVEWAILIQGLSWCITSKAFSYRLTRRFWSVVRRASSTSLSNSTLQYLKHSGPLAAMVKLGDKKSSASPVSLVQPLI